MMRLPALALLLLLLTTGCSALPGGSEEDAAADTTRAPGVPPPGEGLVTVATARSVSATADRLKSALRQNSAVSLVADIDHAARAGGDSLRPTRLLLFGNPALGTPLMQSVQTVGLDLPQKMLVWQGADDSTRVTYNAPVYLQARHDLSGVGGALSKMATALAGLAEQAAGQAPDTAAFNADSIEGGAGIEVKASDFGFDETLSRLREAVQARSGLSIMAELDHAENASTVGDSLRPDRTGGSSPGLRPTHLLVAGNPDAGTPLMRKAPTVGIDLPQKLLVYEGPERGVFVAYNKPPYLAYRHAFSDSTRLARIGRTLEDLTMQATANRQEMQDLREAKEDTTGIAF